MVKNVLFSQRGKISPTSLDKMALVSAKIKIRSEILREWPQIINIKSQKISNRCSKPFLKYSLWIHNLNIFIDLVQNNLNGEKNPVKTQNPIYSKGKRKQWKNLQKGRISL